MSHMFLLSKIESVLFVASKPLSLKDIARAVQQKEDEIKLAVEELKVKYNQEGSGIRILEIDDKIQMATSPDNAGVVDLFIKQEAVGELTRPQLETLTVIAYRGPLTRPELEQIRGVNCSIILRNLLLRGLIEENEDDNKILPTYLLSFEALRHLGLNSPAELPDYQVLHTHDFIEKALTAENN